MTGPGPFYTLDPVLVAAGVGVLAGVALLATGVMVLLILQHASRAGEITALREKAETAIEATRLAEAARARAESGLARARAAAEAHDLWAFDAAPAPMRGTGLPALALIAPRDGAGPAALAAALAARCDAAGERVLLIDLDPLGGLTARIRGTRTRPGEAGGARDLLRRTAHAPWPVPGTAGAALIDADPELATAERRLTLHWLIDPRAEDPRLILARLLGGARLRDRFDRAILVAAPGPGLAGVAALAAASHVLIPVPLDTDAAAALDALLERLDRLRPGPLPAAQAWRVAGLAPDGAGETAAAAAEEIVAALAARGAPEAWLGRAPGPWAARLGPAASGPVRLPDATDRLIAAVAAFAAVAPPR